MKTKNSVRRSHNYMRVLSYILIALGIYLLAAAFIKNVREERSSRRCFQAAGMSANRGYLYSIPVLRDQNPELFSKFMVTHWIYAGVVEAGGCVLCLKTRQDNDL